MAEEHEEHHHHHHHHHHRSSSSQIDQKSSPFIKVADIQDYSVRTFGRKSQTDSLTLPEGALSIILCSIMVTALVIAPVVIKLLFRNKELSASNEQLRARLGVLMAKLEEKGVDDQEPTTAKARYIDDAPAAEELVATAPASPEAASADVAAPPPVAPESLDTIAAAIGIDKKDLAALKADMEVFPNGMRYEIDENGEDALVPDPLANNISNAITLYFLDQKRDAASILRMVSGAKPLWPYAHFLLGVASGERAELERANLLFSAARAMGALPPEGELYRAACSLFLGSTTQALASIERMELIAPDNRELQIGIIPAPANAPAHILTMLRKACGADNIRTVE